MVKTLPERKSGPSRLPERDGSSGSGGRFKGVRKRKWGKWVAEVRLPRSRDRIWLGSYDSPDKAARAYDAAVYCLRGPAATFNFPDTPPDIPSGGSLNPVEIREVAARFANEVGSGGGGRDAVVQQPTEIESPAVSVATEDLLRGDNWGFMETFLPESGHARPDLGVFPPSGDFPAEHYIPAEEEEDETSGGAFFHCPGLWSF